MLSSRCLNKWRYFGPRWTKWRCIGYVLFIYSFLVTSYIFIKGKSIKSPLRKTLATPDYKTLTSIAESKQELVQATRKFIKENVTEGWVPINHERHAYVFAAYGERDVITVIGALKVPSEIGLACRVWYKSEDGFSDTTTEDRKATITRLPEGHDKRYTSVKIYCPADKSRTSIWVSILPKMGGDYLHLLPVQQITKENHTRNFTVCVTPLNFRYSRAYELVEWIELNKILGADRFTFYNYSTAENVDRVLEKYVHAGEVEVVQWRLPMAVDTWPRTNQSAEIHYFGQVAALNDCQLRNRQHTKYIANIDLDEFIIPYQEKDQTWYDIIANFPTGSAFLFQNVFFRKEWVDNKTAFAGREQAEKYKLVTLLNTYHEKQLWGFSKRSKFIYESNSVNMFSIHDIYSMSKKRQKIHVSSQYAILHHYRNWEIYDDKQKRIEGTIIRDKYKDELIKCVVDAWSDLKNVSLEL